ncbi:hypothetical protein DFH29DRAFT_1030328 [Suillus ampliporus]|nr:hypothetical protein DFH29DRAFT_1030328 [Suillus ampliporus]
MVIREHRENALANAELNDEDAQKLQDIQKDIQRVELVIERQAMHKLTPVYEKRHAIVKSIDKFWPMALMNNSMISFHVQHKPIDQLALSYLEDLWIVCDPKEPRCYTIEFYFKANPYFTDSVLKKEYKYATSIHQKDPENALTRLHPRVAEVDGEDDMPTEAGSFFNFLRLQMTPLKPNAKLIEITQIAKYFMQTEAGHRLLARYHRTQDSRDLDQSI